MTPMRLTRLLLPAMKEAGQGHVINIASIEALYPYPSAPAYSATKWGLRGWSKALFAVSEMMEAFVLTPGISRVHWSKDHMLLQDLLVDMVRTTC